MRMTTRLTRLAAMIVSALWAGAALADVSDADLARPAGGDWLHANGNWDGTRFSTLDQIDASNVGDLRVKWIYPIDGEADEQVTVIEHEGLLFLSQNNVVHAVNSMTGELFWKYSHDAKRSLDTKSAIDLFPIKRSNLAMSGSKVYFLSKECSLTALHYVSGEKLFSHKMSRLDLTNVGDLICAAGPLAVPGKIIAPINVFDGVKLSGYISGFDLAGEYLWVQEIGDVRLPAVGSYDAELKRYFTVAEYDQRNASEVASVIAVDVNDGELIWRGGLPEDTWDYGGLYAPEVGILNGVVTLSGSANSARHFSAKDGKEIVLSDRKEIVLSDRYVGDWLSNLGMGNFVMGDLSGMTNAPSSVAGAGSKLYADMLDMLDMLHADLSSEHSQRKWYTGGGFSTAGNITVFAEGGIVRAVNSSTGENLYQFFTNLPSTSSGITYMVRDDQQITFTFSDLSPADPELTTGLVDRASFMLNFALPSDR